MIRTQILINLEKKSLCFQEEVGISVLSPEPLPPFRLHWIISLGKGSFTLLSWCKPYRVRERWSPGAGLMETDAQTNICFIWAVRRTMWERNIALISLAKMQQCSLKALWNKYHFSSCLNSAIYRSYLMIHGCTASVRKVFLFHRFMCVCFLSTLCI